VSESLVQVTVRVEPRVLQAAKQRAGEMKVSLSAAIAEAAKESLLSSYRREREQEILKAVDRNFHALRRLEQQLGVDLQVLKEMIGLGMRSFFNHTTAIPDSLKSAALLSGKQRFHRYLDMLARNVRTGDSILSDVPLSEPQIEPAKPPPQSKPSSMEPTGSTARQRVPAHVHSSPRHGSNDREASGLFSKGNNE
jgi:hypothetical protein